MTPTATPTRMTAWLEQAWLVRYLNRRLSSEEVTWFESYLLDKPDLLAMIEADTRLRDALAADASMRHKDRSVDGGSRQGKAATEAGVQVAPAAVSRRTGYGRLALAASLVLGVGAGAIGTALLGPASGNGVEASPTRIVYDTLRGSDSAPRVEHADSASRFVLIEVAVPPDAANIVLLGAGAPEQRLTPTPDGFVNFLLERQRMARDDLQIGYTREGLAVRKRLDLPTLKL